MKSVKQNNYLTLVKTAEDTINIPLKFNSNFVKPVGSF